jgi:hypothetical protein
MTSSSKYIGMDVHKESISIAVRNSAGKIVIEVPMRFKLRKVPGEPVPANVLAAMEQEPNQPWVVRDRMLVEIGWTPDGIPWAEWKAASLNKLFLEQGVTGRPGKITAAAVRHCESGGTR